MKADFYNLRQGNLLTVYQNGYNNNFEIELNQDSGRIVQRAKFGGAISHTGIYLGKCPNTRVDIYIHNHPTQGKASIVNGNEFAQGMQIFWENTPCSYSPEQIIQRGLDAVAYQLPYKVLSSNCQHLTSVVCTGKKQSRDLDKWMGAGVLFGAFFFGAKLLKA